MSSDALGDLLSDESDSFFEDPKVLAKRASLTKTPDKKAVSDLFGLGADKSKEKAQSKETDWLGLGAEEANEEKVKVSEPSKSAGASEKLASTLKTAKKISFEGDDDILDTLGFDDKVQVDIADKESDANKKMLPPKKSTLIESIFGPPKQQTEQFTSFEDILKESKISKQRPETAPTPPAQKSELAAKPVIQKQNVGYAATDLLTREGRRSRHQPAASGVLDPLGLFSNEPSGTSKGARHGEGDAGTTITEAIPPTRQKDLSTKSTPNIPKDAPDWLLQGEQIKASPSDPNIAKSGRPTQMSRRMSNVSRKEADISQEPTALEQTSAVNNTDVALNNPMLNSLLAQQKLTSSHIEYQNTSIALQQQESQLLMALQLKKYEENLAEIQKKQQEVLIKQEHQFNELLERQFAKQQVMENNMRLQQERINNHIQLLISQPTITSAVDEEAKDQVFQLKKTNASENSRLYEEMIATLKQRQHEEIFLLNESYTKQISLLENSMKTVEDRLKTEFTNLSEQFQATIDHVKKENETEIDKYKQKLEEMSNQHGNEIKLIRENHNRIVEEIKYEYTTMIENMKQARRTETSVVDNAHVYSEKLGDSLEMLEVNSKLLTEIRGKVQNDYGILSTAREESLKAKEEEIKMMRVTLEKSRESAETERAQLMALVRSLEMKLVEQNQSAREERWAMQQAAAVLTSRSEAFDREVEFTRAVLEREKEQLKSRKESMLNEQQHIMLQLTEEKLAIAAEKSKLETSVKLNQNYELQKSRAEVDAAIQVAREAAQLTDRERETLHRQQNEVERLKRSLSDKEQQLSMKENELQALILNAERKARDGEKALADARILEVKYGSRLKDIQTQLVSLTNREKKLAEDKIALSKERLTLHSNLRQTKKCGLCTSEATKHEDNDFAVDIVEQDFSPRLFTVTDPDILRLRYEITGERTSGPRDAEETI